MNHSRMALFSPKRSRSALFSVLCGICLGDFRPPSASLHAAEAESWRAEANQRIEAHRKGDFTLRIVDGSGKPQSGVPVHVRLIRHEFLFGTAVNTGLLTAKSGDGQRYREFLSRNFSALVAENCMKWYHVEKTRGTFDFAEGDAIADFADKHDFKLRGHCLLWDKQKFLPAWAKELPAAELEPLAVAQVRRMAERYRGRLVAWDVNNEMLDGGHYARTIRPEVNAEFFKIARETDPGTPLFVNEYHIVDSDERTDAYLALIQSLRDQGTGPDGIGIQEHASERMAAGTKIEGDQLVERQSTDRLDPEGMWKRLDRLAATALPIHITEVSARTADEGRRADALEAMYRTAFAHPGVEAIMIWGFWEKSHWIGREAALVAADWSLLPAGKRIFEDLLSREWTTDLTAVTDADGTIRFRGFFGTYSVQSPGLGESKVRFGRKDPRNRSTSPSESGRNGETL